MSAPAEHESGTGSLRAVKLIFGPPGTGKTTELARRVGVTVAQHGGDGIRIGSFSRTAAAEIASREEVRSALPHGAVGTMHHHAYAAIEHPPIALDPEVIEGWNGSVAPTWRISGQVRGGANARAFEARDRIGGGPEPVNGDDTLEQLDMLRSTRVHPSMWPLEVKQFARAWTDWKREAGCVDFCDMIIQAWHRARDGERMPGDPRLIVIDEAQDMTDVEVELALAWGSHLDPDDGHHLVFALDDDQAIMEWRGGDPRRILGLQLDADRQAEVLARSHRVPPAVHAAANRWIRNCSVRYPKNYTPRTPTDSDATPAHSHGWVQRVGYSLSSGQLLDKIEADLADPDVPDNPAAAVMVIAACGYMLHPLLKGLKKRGIPFHNPFRGDEQSWNPLGKPGRGVSTAERIYRYAVVNGADLGVYARRWTGEDIRYWTDLISVREAALAPKVKTHVIPALPDGEVERQIVRDLFRDSPEGRESLARATRGDLDWLASVITNKQLAGRAAYPIEVAKMRGARAIAEPPRVVVGTIHSTKGAQASRVYLAPDLSPAGRRQWSESLTGRDQVVRLMYVGLTRAYHECTVLAPDGQYSVVPSEMVPPELEVRR